MIIGNFFKQAKFENKKHKFSGICFYSSECKKGDIFFAIKGAAADGNKFINHAIQKGARTIVSSQEFEGFKKNVLYIKSINVRKSLALVSYAVYKNKPKNIIAVTGTNGKSSIVDFYFQILKLNKKKVASIGTLGIQTISSKRPVLNTTLDPIKLSSCLNDLKKKK